MPPFLGWDSLFAWNLEKNIYGEHPLIIVTYPLGKKFNSNWEIKYTSAHNSFRKIAKGKVPQHREPWEGICSVPLRLTVSVWYICMHALIKIALRTSRRSRDRRPSQKLKKPPKNNLTFFAIFFFIPQKYDVNKYSCLIREKWGLRTQPNQHVFRYITKIPLSIVYDMYTNDFCWERVHGVWFFN